LTAVIRDQGFESLIGESRRVSLGRQGNIADVTAGLVKDADQRSAAIVATREDRRSQSHEPPEQVKGFVWVRLGYCLDDGMTLSIEIIQLSCRKNTARPPPLLTRFSTVSGMNTRSGGCGPAAALRSERRPSPGALGDGPNAPEAVVALALNRL
jgi:hypothetical protein